MFQDLFTQPLYFYSTKLADCPYLPGQKEQKLLTDLTQSEDPFLLSCILSRRGFRRSHSMGYLPVCPTCRECVSVRVPVRRFSPGKNLRKILSKNKGSSIKNVALETTREQYDIFRTYLHARHGQSDMASMGEDEYIRMVDVENIGAALYEFRNDKTGTLEGAVLTDLFDDGMSAVYSFFSPELRAKSFGTFMVLALIEECRAKNLPYLYLGFYVKDCHQMNYKKRFHPLEMYRDGVWVPFETDED